MLDAPPTDLLARLRGARDEVARQIERSPRIGIVLGSGLGAMAETLEDPVVVPYQRIPGWPVSTVEGHAGRLIAGRIGSVDVVVMQGRVHLYEGYAPWQVVFPTRVLALLGCDSLVVTNAAGAIDPGFEPGDLMLITDHLNLQGINPCTGPNLDRLGLRFFDMTHAYSPAYFEVARMAALERDLVLREGVYAGLLGPSYETPAEIRMLRTLGADAVGMSTVPEVIAANHAGLRVVGISCMTNMAAGVLDAPLHHEEVMEIAERVRDDFVGLLQGIVRGIAEMGAETGAGNDG
jgi:purine-nucleoside phosphorylase